MSFKYKCLAIIPPLVFLFDQLTKYFVAAKISIGEGIPIIAGFFDVVHYRNTGAAFGLFSGANEAWRTPFFYVVSALALVIIVYYIIKLNPLERMMPVALSLVVGGIFGNGLDRVRQGFVTDFLSLHVGDKYLWGVRLEWPAFNVADSAITVAMILLIVGSFRCKN